MQATPVWGVHHFEASHRLVCSLRGREIGRSRIKYHYIPGATGPIGRRGPQGTAWIRAYLGVIRAENREKSKGKRDDGKRLHKKRGMVHHPCFIPRLGVLSISPTGLIRMRELRGRTITRPCSPLPPPLEAQGFGAYFLLFAKKRGQAVSLAP